MTFFHKERGILVLFRQTARLETTHQKHDYSHKGVVSVSLFVIEYEQKGKS